MLPRFLALALVASVAVAVGAPRASRTSITVWSGSGALGGATYGGVPPSTGALVVERRDVEIAGGEIRLEGVSRALDPASVQLRDLGDPGLTITQQRFVAGAQTPTEAIARHAGEQVTLGTAKGEISGVLRSVDDQTIAVEVGGKLEVVRRDFVQTVRLTAGNDKALLSWRVAGAKPGPHAIEVSYRTGLMAWSADYLAVLDEAAATVDFSAWATIKNATGTRFDGAMLSLVGDGNARFEVPAPVQLDGNDSVQVELMPMRRGAKSHTIVALDTLADDVAQADADTAIDCTQYVTAPVGAASAAIEVDLPATPLPDGHIRIFRRLKDRLEVVAEDDFHAVPGHARLKLAGDSPITLLRRATSCNYDDQAKTLKERVEIALANTGKQALDAVVHEMLWRGKDFKLDAEQPHGATIAPQQREYRVRVPAGGKQTIAYTVRYQW